MRKTKENSVKKQESSGTLMILFMAIINIVLGIVMLTVEQIQLKNLCYIFTAFLVIFGVGLIVKYFLTESYKNINQYGFSVGILLILLGMCALLKTDELAKNFSVLLGIWLLVSAIIKLQYALDLKALEDFVWAVLLAVAAVMAVCAVLIIVNPFPNNTHLTYFTYIVLIIDGAFSLFATAYLAFRIRKYDKAMEKLETDLQRIRPEDVEEQEVSSCMDTDEIKDDATENVEQDGNKSVEEENNL